MQARNTLIALTTALLALATAACPSSAPPETSAPAVPEGPAPALADPAELSWTRHSPDPATFGAEAATMIFGSTTARDGTHVVAVGVDRSQSPQTAAAWSGTDGADWTRTDPATVAGSAAGNSTAMRDVTATDTGYVAVGFEFAATGEAPLGADAQGVTEGETTAATWTSSDGRNWTRVAPATPADLAGSLMTRILRVPGGLLALGEDVASGAGTAWIATDPASWRRVSAESGLRASEGRAGFQDATVLGATILIAGSVKVTDGRNAAMWRSADSGATWLRVESPEFTNRRGAEINALLPFQSGLVAAGAATEEGTDAAAVWVSPDGVAWNRVPHVEDVFGGAGGDAILLLRKVGDGILGLGRASPGRPDPDAAVWTSLDGVSWRREAAPSDTFGGSGTEEFLTASIAGDRVIATGRSRRVDRDRLRFVDREIMLWSAQQNP